MEGLIVESGSQQGVVVEFTEDMVIIGRTDACHIRLDDDQVSREHAAIVREGRRAVLRDMKSRNGTTFDGRFVKSRALKSGDVFCVGSTQIRYTDQITSDDRTRFVNAGVETRNGPRPVRKVRVVHDGGETSKLTYACLICCLVAVNWLFALLALGLGVGALIEIKRRGDLRGTKLTLLGCLVALAFCGYHGHERIWLPALQRWHETQAMHQCRLNLRVMHNALLRYLTDHPTAYPENLGELCPKYLDPRHLVFRLAHEPDTLPQGFPVSYLYFGRGAPLSGTDVVLVVDHHALNHQGRGRHVLFSDGRIDFVPEVPIESMLEKARTQGADAAGAGQ